MSGAGKFAFMQVDAFTDHALGGNPCAVVFDADSLDDGMRQRIAQEMNLSETAFVQQAVSADAAVEHLLGRRLDAATVAEAARLCRRAATPLDNTDFSPAWRGTMVEQLARRALLEAAGMSAE